MATQMATMNPEYPAVPAAVLNTKPDAGPRAPVSRARELLQAVDRIIDSALSSDSAVFLKATRQTGGE